MIGIIDYKCGNFASIANMLSKLGHKVEKVNDDASLMKASFLVLPGVGNFAYGMNQFNSLPYKDMLVDKIKIQGIPTLGICMGMQLMSLHSEEGDCAGLGLFDLKTFQFPNSGPLPHMGWAITSSTGKLDSPKKSRFYFSHSYYVEYSDKLTTHYCEYNGIKFSAALQKNNIIGCQFHPEKSHKFGMEFLKDILSRSYE